MSSLPEYSYTHLKVEMAEGVAHVVLNDPAKRNRLSMQMLEELTDAFTKIRQDERIQSILLSGEGKVFCSGADLEWVATLKGKKKEQVLPEVHTIMHAFETMHHCGKPLIAVVQGSPAGGGVALAALCDYVVAEEGAKFQISEKHLGLLPLAMYPYLLPRTGVDNTITASSREAALSASEAVCCGLVDAVADSGNAYSQAMRLARKAAADPGWQREMPGRGKAKLPRGMEIDVDAARHLRMIDGYLDNPQARNDLVNYVDTHLCRILTNDEVQAKVGLVLEKIHRQR